MRCMLVILTVVLLVGVAPFEALAGPEEDRAIATELAQNLKRSGRLSGYKIGVKVREGTAWLIGNVADQAQGRAALDMARRTEGVGQVVSRLTVGEGGNRSAGPAGNPAPRRGPSASDAAVRQAASHHRAARAAIPSAGPGAARRPNVPLAYAASSVQPVSGNFGGGFAGGGRGGPLPAHGPSAGGQIAPASFDQANMPGYAWPSYASHPNYAAITYPKQYSPTAWPFIGPFYPYPQVPLGWRKVTLEWDDGWWQLDFKD